MGERSCIANKVQCAIGADVNSVKRLPIDADGERSRNIGAAIIAVVT